MICFVARSSSTAISIREKCALFQQRSYAKLRAIDTCVYIFAREHGDVAVGRFGALIALLEMH
jgi:hypothetical protein